MGNCGINPNPSVQIGDYEFNPSDIIGMGQSGVLFQGSPRNNKLFEIAIKQISHSFDSHGFSKVKEYASKLMSVQHKNLAQYIDYYFDTRNKKLYLIIEFCAHGNLHDLMQNEVKLNPLQDLKTALTYCQQLIAGLVALHEKDIIHQNLRPRNVLIHYENLKISDFGLIELEKMSVEGVKEKQSIYRAPELAQGESQHSKKSDIWSLGVLMYQIIYKTRPVDISGREYVINTLKTGKFALLDDLIAKCLVVNPAKRVSTEELKSHPFLRADLNHLKGAPQSIANFELNGI